MIRSYATAEYGAAFKVGDRVEHTRDQDYTGTIVRIEENLLSFDVLWDGCDEIDFVWCDRVRHIEPS